MSRTYSLTGLRKHGVTIGEILEVLASDPMDFDLPEGGNGSIRVRKHLGGDVVNENN